MPVPSSANVRPGRPLTASEHLIWAGQRLDIGLPLYNMTLAIELDGRLDPVVLAEALKRVTVSSDALRTVVQGDEASPRCVVLPEVDLDVDTVDLDADGWDDTVRGLVEERARRLLPMNEPMTDLALFRGPDRSVLFINQHHLVTDATSTGLLYRRLSEEYEALVDGEPGRVPGLPQYASYAEQLEVRQESPEYRRAIDHWGRSGRSDGDPLSFYGVAASGSGRTERVRVPLGARRTAALESLIQRPEFRALSPDHSRFLALSTVLAAWIARATDRSEVAIGVPSHNRATADLRETMGLLIELYPLRVGLEADCTFAQVAKSVGAETLSMMRYAVPGSSAAPGSRDFGVVLNYITAELGDFAGVPGRADWVHTGYGDPAHALRLQVHDFDGSGRPTLDFDLDRAVFGELERRWAVDHF